MLPDSTYGRRVVALMTEFEAKPGAAARPISAPRAKSPNALIYYVCGKMFAILSVRGEEYLVLKCDPALAEMLRSRYAGVGHRTHLDKRFWIAVDLDADVPSREIKRLAEHSYELVRAGLPRKQQAELPGAAGSTKKRKARKPV